MSSRSLEEDLIDIPGVEGAERDGTGDSPAGLRIRIAQGADQRTVGGAIRRVLTKHGLGTDTKLPGEEDVADDSRADQQESDVLEDGPLQEEDPQGATVAGPGVEHLDHDVADRSEGVQAPSDSESTEAVGTPSPVAVLTDSAEDDVEAPAQVIDLTDLVDGDDDLVETDGPEDRTDATEVGVEASPDPGSWTASQEALAEPVAETDVAPQPSRITASPQARKEFSVVSRIDSVAVEEGRDGIVVTVASTDGRIESQPASSTEGGVESAVVNAAARLAQPGTPDPTIVEIEDRRIEGVDIVMIVLDIDGAVSAGSAIVVAGRSFALGRATWAALSL